MTSSSRSWPDIVRVGAVLLVDALLAGLLVWLLRVSLTDAQLLIGFEKVRGSLIGAFLSCSSLLFALNAFVMVNLKKDVFESKEYLTILAHRGVNRPQAMAPLVRLNALIGSTILLSVLTVIANLLLGFSGTLAAALVCLFLSCFALTLLLTCFVNVWLNLHHWLKAASR